MGPWTPMRCGLHHKKLEFTWFLQVEFVCHWERTPPKQWTRNHGIFEGQVNPRPNITAETKHKSFLNNSSTAEIWWTRMYQAPSLFKLLKSWGQVNPRPNTTAETSTNHSLKTYPQLKFGELGYIKHRASSNTWKAGTVQQVSYSPPTWLLQDTPKVYSQISLGCPPFHSGIL